MGISQFLYTYIGEPMFCPLRNIGIGYTSLIILPLPPILPRSITLPSSSTSPSPPSPLLSLTSPPHPTQVFTTSFDDLALEGEDKTFSQQLLDQLNKFDK